MDTINIVLNVVTLLLGGGLLGVWLLHRREMPKAGAESHRIHAEADERDWGRFHKEIGRLEERISKQDVTIDILREDALKSRQRESNLEQKVRSQNSHIKRIETRMAGMERIFHIHGMTPEMKAELEKLEAVTSLAEFEDDPDKSHAMNAAEGAVRSARTTLHKSQDTYEEVKHSEEQRNDGA